MSLLSLLGFQDNFEEMYSMRNQKILNDNDPMSLLAKITEKPVPHGIYRAISKNTVIVEYHCNKCNAVNELQADFGDELPLQENCIPFPADNQLYCNYCDTHHDLSELRNDVELKFNGVKPEKISE